ncbi:Uncharacterised protein [Mycobacteroides abscessus subsp. abscessus]|nr:Uncharacterised protein [Mycobacteroides abscessus subsp. abscessus]
MEALGGPAEMKFVGDCEKRAQLTQFHVAPPGFHYVVLPHK